MEECESLDTQMEELQDFQCESSDTISQDDEDEVEELQNSLREVVQDQSVKPKLQCLMVDPSFSMVTVQSEDSGITWETASSRCSTPWASETSSTSEAYSMEGPGAAGKITIVFDEEKIIRRRTRSGGRSSRLGDRLSRPGSSRSASALGVERPEMAEVSLPNVKADQSQTEPDLEEIKNKDQQLFSLISEGYEILNIRVPSKLPTVDEEESTELQDNLSYLDQTPKIRSRNHFDWTQQAHVLPEETTEDKQEPLTQEAEQEDAQTPTPKETATDIDYFEKFTLLDEVVPGEQAPEQQEAAEQAGEKPQDEEQKPAKEAATESPAASEESFVFVTDVEIVGEHLDEVFYGEGPPADSLHHLETEDEERMRTRRESQRSMKESGSLLFGGEETILTPIYISAGPPKIIDQILLDEPTAMSFMYSDLYEDAVGERKKSDEERSEAESVVSERSYRRRFSDSEEAPDGYLEKFTLKDEIPVLDIQPESVEEKKEGRMMWPQNKFEMTGCLIRVAEEDEKERKEAEEAKMEEGSVGHESKDLPSAVMEKKKGGVTETEEERDEKQVVAVVQEQAGKEAVDDSTDGPELMEGKMEDQQEKVTVKPDIPEPAEPSTEKQLPKAQQEDLELKEEEKTEDHQDEEEKTCEEKEVLGVTAEQTVVTSVSSEATPVSTKSETQTETTESLPEEASPDTEKLAAAEEEVTQAPEEASAAVKEPESAERETPASTEPPTGVQGPPETSSACEEEDAAGVIPEDAAPVEVTTDSDCVMQTIVEVTEKATNEKEIQTQVQIDLQDVTGEKKNDVPAEVPERKPASESVIEETAAEKLPNVMSKEVEPEIPGEETEPVMPEEVETESEKKLSEVFEAEQQHSELTARESDQMKLVTEEKTCHTAEESGSFVQDIVNVGDELIVFVPKGQAVEMDIEVSQWPEKATEDVVTEPELQSEVNAPEEEIKIEPPIEDKPEVAVLEKLPQNEAESECRLPEVVEESETERKESKPEIEGDKVVLSPLRSFTPLEDLSELHREEEQPDHEEEEQKLAEPEIEAGPEVVETQQLTQDEVESETQPPEPVEEPHTMEVELEFEKEKLVSSPLMSLTPLEDLSKKEIQLEDEDLEGKVKMQKTEAVTEEVPQEKPDDEHQAAEPAKEHETTEQELEQELEPEFEEDKNVTSSLRSFTPLEDLSALHMEELQPEDEEADQKLESHKIEDEPEVVMEETLQKESGDEHQASEPLEEPKAEEEVLEADFEEDSVVPTKLRSFAPLEDLSELHGEDILSEDAAVEQKLEIHKTEEEPKIDITKEEEVPYEDLHREAPQQKTEQEEAVADAPEVLLEELEYEVITKQDIPEMPEQEGQKGAEEQKLEPVLKQKEELGVENEEPAELSPEEELIEADYEIIDAEEENQARLAAELQGMDWFCVTCGCLLSEEHRVSGEHQGHEVNSVDKAYEDIKETLSGWISELQGRSENIEDLVSELELAYNSVEDSCVESEAAMQAQNEEMMAQVMEQYNNMSISMEEEKKAKLEQLYDQIVSFQESIDSTKATLETTSREAETDARSPEDIQSRLKAALDSALSLELGPKGLLVFEDYAKANTSSSNLTQRKGIPVPQRPTLQPQEPGSATSTSVTVYWRVNPGDIIDCFQVYCMEDPQGAVTEEYRVTVKESYCVLEELDADKMYKVWVMAVNYTGCSLPSERLIFRTAPSVPAIHTERCTVLWDSASLRWSSPTQAAGQSYTLEYCRQYELEGEGLRSISGISACEQTVLLQPNENYLFYIKAVNEAGVSEQSEAALISTKGTRFHLLSASAHPKLELSEDRTTVHYPQDAHRAAAASDKQCPSILGDLLPARGLYYWETTVSGCAAYRLGVSHSTADRSVSLGDDSHTWCLQCVPSPSGCRYQLLHNNVQSSVLVTETPERVGTLLDYQLGRLSFYNTQGGQLLGTFRESFTQPCHPALALELPGSLGVSTVLEVPEFTKDS